MQLLTQEIRNKIPKMNETAEEENPRVYAKFFGGGRWSWYAMEFDGEDIFFGYVRSGLDDTGGYDELGSFSLSELEQAKFPPFGLPTERDKFWDDKSTLEQVMSGEVI